MRHAVTLWNLEKRIQGRLNADLAPEGEDMARRWGVQLKDGGWQRLLASSSGRALHTARLVNQTLALPLSQDDRLQEQDWGRWSSLRLADLKAQYGTQLAEQVAAGWDFRPPGGESRTAVWERSRQALVDSAARWSGRQILVVTHEGVIKCLLYRLAGRKFLPRESPLIKSGHLHLVEVRNGRLVLIAVNHLGLG
jgi:probable phosphoglycerate mutase